MIRDVQFWREWEEKGPLREPADFARNLQLYDSMYQLARSLGKFPPADPLEGLDTDIRLARILNARSAAWPNRPRA